MHNCLSNINNSNNTSECLWCCFEDQCYSESSLVPMMNAYSVPSGCQPSAQANQLAAESAGRLLPSAWPSPFVIVTQLISWYSFHHATEGGRLSCYWNQLNYCNRCSGDGASEWRCRGGRSKPLVIDGSRRLSAPRRRERWKLVVNNSNTRRPWQTALHWSLIYWPPRHRRSIDIAFIRRVHWRYSDLWWQWPFCWYNMPLCDGEDFLCYWNKIQPV